jgi:hypothetical protein
LKLEREIFACVHAAVRARENARAAMQIYGHRLGVQVLRGTNTFEVHAFSRHHYQMRIFVPVR